MYLWFEEKYDANILLWLLGHFVALEKEGQNISVHNKMVILQE